MSRSSTSTKARRPLAALLLLPALLAAGCATAPEEDPVQLRLDDLDARVGRIDRIVANQSLVQLAQQVESLQGEVRGLKGRLDELQNENATLRREQRDLYADLDGRLKAGAAAPSAFAPESATASGGDEQARYDQAFNELKNRNYAAAVQKFRELAAAYPNGQLADNTQYWLGEAYYVNQEYDQAAAAFQRVLTVWPQSRKAPDAMLKLGYTQIEQRKVAEGRATLQQLVASHPDSDAARLARERLQRLPAGTR
ncbi:MAG: tol-pal system protein YbgF [Steroidobacteraceae bacterium]